MDRRSIEGEAVGAILTFFDEDDVKVCLHTTLLRIVVWTRRKWMMTLLLAGGAHPEMDEVGACRAALHIAALEQLPSMAVDGKDSPYDTNHLTLSAKQYIG